MFYSQFILAKKGPLGTIWIAAHLERKLRKNQVTETNISVSVDSILFPEVPIALRLSGHLLLGVVRIYSRKVNYLFHDCSEALTKIKQAFHSGAVDLPPEAATAPFHAITLPENFDLDELEPLPERESNALFSSSSADHHVTTREQITLQDPLGDDVYAAFELDERFADADADKIGMDDFDEDRPEKSHDREQSSEKLLEEDALLPMAEDDGIDFDRMDVLHHHESEPATPAVVREIEDDDMFEHTLRIDSVGPMMDEDERFEPSHDDERELGDWQQNAPPTLNLNLVDLNIAQKGENITEKFGDSPEVAGSSCTDHPIGVETVKSMEVDTAYGLQELDKENEENVAHGWSHGTDIHREVEFGSTDVIKPVDELESVHEAVPEETMKAAHHESVVPVQEEAPGLGLENSGEALGKELGELDGDAMKPVDEDAANLSIAASNGEKEHLLLAASKKNAVDVIEEGPDGLHDQHGIPDVQQVCSPPNGNVARGRAVRGTLPSPEEVPDYEVARSAVDGLVQTSDMFELDKEPICENVDAQTHAKENVHEIMVDLLPAADHIDEVMEDVLQEAPSPHSRSSAHEDFHPDNNDVLAELLAERGTPALGVVPTPTADVVAKPSKSRVSRKRKAEYDYFDLRTVIAAEAMRDQLVDTHDIRRERKKAPCTSREFWLLQKEIEASHGFREPSTPGLCPALQQLFHRVCVYGEANLPKLGMNSIVPEKRKSLPLEMGTEEIEHELHTVGHLEATTDGSGALSGAPGPQQNATNLKDGEEVQQDASSEVALKTGELSRNEDSQANPDIDTVMEDQCGLDLDGTGAGEGHQTPAEFERVVHEAADRGVEDGAVLEVAGEAEDEEEAARAAREAVLLEWESFDNAKLEDSSFKQAGELESRAQKKEAPPAQCNGDGQAWESGDLEGGDGMPKQAEEKPARSEAEIETEKYPRTASYFQTGHLETDICIETQTRPDDGVNEKTRVTSETEADLEAFCHNEDGLTAKGDTETKKAQESYGEGHIDSPRETDGVSPTNILQGANALQEASMLLDSGSATELHSAADGRSQQKDGYMPGFTEPGGDFLKTISDHTDAEHNEPQLHSSAADMAENGSVYVNGSCVDGPGGLEEEIEEEDMGFLGDPKEAVSGEGEDDANDSERDEYMEATDYGKKVALVQDNSGWSVRTRAVGRYLKATLEGMEMNKKRVDGMTFTTAKLGLEKTLAGKSRKEAARMFFETLVLATKDYIQVEQVEPFSDIKLSARPRLLKAAF